MKRFLQVLSVLVALASLLYYFSYFSDRAKSAKPEFRFRYMILSLQDPHGEIPLDKRLNRIFNGAQIYLQDNLLTHRMKNMLQVSRMVLGQTQSGHKYSTLDEYFDGAIPEGARSGQAYLPTNDFLLSKHSLAGDPVAVRLAGDNRDLRGLFSVVLADESQVCGSDATTHRLLEQIDMQPMSVLILDIENIANTPARALSLKMKRYRDHVDSYILYPSIFPALTEEVQSDTAPFTIDTLTKGEHLLVPMALMLQTNPGPGLPPYPLNRTPIQTSKLAFTDTPSLSLYEWRLRDFSEHRLYLGPDYRVDFVSAAGSDFPVRRLEDAKFTYADLEGGEYGSCPFVFTYSVARQEWLRVGRVLVNADGKAKERREILSLPAFTGRLAIRELEPEITHLDYAAIHVTDVRGISTTCQADNSRISRQDGSHLDLSQGEELRITCQSSGPFAGAHLEVVGYYDRSASVKPRRATNDGRGAARLRSYRR
jgi:hypothetical protein